MDDLDSRCLMSNPVATLFANAGSVFIRLPLAMGLVTLLVLCLFASGCETGPDHRVRDVEMTQTQRMDLPAAAAEEQQITLILGGHFCEFYPDKIKKALTELSGVKAVDLKSKKGHALVTVDTSKTNTDALTAAVYKVRGYRWHCTAVVM